MPDDYFNEGEISEEMISPKELKKAERLKKKTRGRKVKKLEEVHG